MHPDVVEVLYKGKLIEAMPRLRGDRTAHIDYRHRALTGKVRRIGIIDDTGPYLRIGDDFLSFFSGVLEADLYRGLFQPVRPATVPLDAHFVDGASTEHLLRLLGA